MHRMFTVLRGGEGRGGAEIEIEREQVQEREREGVRSCKSIKGGTGTGRGGAR